MVTDLIFGIIWTIISVTLFYTLTHTIIYLHIIFPMSALLIYLLTTILFFIAIWRLFGKTVAIIYLFGMLFVALLTFKWGLMLI